MACPKYIDQDMAHLALVHAKGQKDRANIGKMAQTIEELLGKRGIERHLTMEGYYREANTIGLNNISKEPCLHTTYTAGRADNDNSIDVNLRCDLMAAAGAAVKELKDIITEMTAMGASLSPEQRMQFVQVIFNTYQLQQVNDGRIELTTAQIEKLSLDTVEILDSLAKDMILPVSLKSVTTGLIRETATVYKLDSVLARLDRFEKETTPQALLEQSVAGLTATLQALLDRDDLEDTTREQIEELLEKLDSLEDGDPLPREVMKEIKALSEALQDQVKAGSLSVETARLVETLTQDTFKVSEANIAVKAEKFGLTIAQVRAIEKTMDRLEEIGEALPEESAELKDQIAEAIVALDQEPTSLKALAKLEAVTEALNSPEIGKLGLVIPALAAAVAPFKTEVVFVQKIQADSITKRDNIPTESVREFSTLYKTMDQAVRDLPKNEAPLRMRVFEALKDFGSKPVSIAAVARVQSVISDLPQAVINRPIQAVTQGVQTAARGVAATANKQVQTLGNLVSKVVKTQSNLLQKVHGIGPAVVKQAIKTFQSLDILRHAVIDAKKPLFRSANDAGEPVKNPTLQKIGDALKAINGAPATISAAVATKIATIGDDIKQLAEKFGPVREALDKAKQPVEDLTKKIIPTIAEKAGKPVEMIRGMIEGAVNVFQPKTPEVTPGYEGPNVSDADIAQMDDIFGKATVEEKKGLFDGFKNKCETCTSAFCNACTGVALRAAKQLGLKPLKSVFGSVAKMAGLKKTRTIGAGPSP